MPPLCERGDASTTRKDNNPELCSKHRFETRGGGFGRRGGYRDCFHRRVYARFDGNL